MTNTFSAATIERDNAGYDNLQEQLISHRSGKETPQEKKEEVTQEAPVKPKAASPKKNVFSKGDSTYELDDDYEIEFMADKRPTKLTVRELKERAAGDIAIKNRMHSLAEEKKQVQATFRRFSEISKNDPLEALRYIADRAKETDSEFEFEQYIQKLAEQAEKLGQMDEKDRKAWELENKLKKAEEDLSQKERVQAVVLRKQQLLSEYPEVGDQELGQMVDSILSTPELMEGIEDESQFMDRVEALMQETLIQRDIIEVIRDVNPEYVHDNSLIFTLSDQIRQNPDFDEEDVKEILSEIIGKKANVQRQKDIRTLSEKARQASPTESIRRQHSTDFDVLAEQLMEKKKDFSKTPRSMR